MRRRHHRPRASVTGFKTYLLIFFLCTIAALALQVLFEAPEQVERYANEKLESAVRSAVQAEVEAAKREAAQGRGP